MPAMRHNLKFIPAIFILALALVISCFSLGDDAGQNTFVKESFNSQHNKKAILFLKETAISTDSYQVTVCNSNHNLDKREVGNTFTVDADDGKTSLDAGSINFSWLNNDTLQIEYDKKLRQFAHETKVDNIAIIYKAR